MNAKFLQDIQKAVAASFIGASLFFGGNARAEVDYDGIKYLGGGDKVDLNNANIRAYLKIQGFYPNLASKIVKYGPFKTVADVYNMPGLSAAEKDTLKKNEGRFVTLDVKPEYDIDKINNGWDMEYYLVVIHLICSVFSTACTDKLSAYC